jgi:GNAT superfamily N-acetyltransferase
MSSVRRITTEDAAALREVRLRALQTDPLSFWSTYEREAGETERWDAWCRRDAAGDASSTFFALADDGTIAGLAGGFRDATDGHFYLVYMWVAPEHRRAGHGGRLIEAVVEWARQAGATELRLDVTDDGARALYERAGFVLDGRRDVLPHAPDVVDLGMTRRLTPGTGAPPPRGRSR